MQTFKGKIDMVPQTNRSPDLNRNMIDDQGKQLLALNRIAVPQPQGFPVHVDNPEGPVRTAGP